jgi:hypothetical protein
MANTDRNRSHPCLATSGSRNALGNRHELHALGPPAATKVTAAASKRISTTATTIERTTSVKAHIAAAIEKRITAK